MQLYHSVRDLPSAHDIARALPGGKVRPGGRISFQDPFDPKPGKLPCTMWLRADLPDGFTVADVRGKIDAIRLKDATRKLVPALGQFEPHSRNSGNGKARSPAGGPVVREPVPRPGRNGEGGAIAPRLLQPQLVVHDAFSLLERPAPPRRWHVENGWMPADDITLLGADGGEGKTTLALQLAYCTAWGFEWLGNGVRAGTAVYYTAEEPMPELHYRLERIKETVVLGGDPPNSLKLVSRADTDSLLATVDGPGMKPTPLLEELTAVVEDTEAKLLVLDAAADVFGGNELDRGQVRSFIRLLRSIANQDLRELERSKANRARRGAKIGMRWRDGYFALEAAGAFADAVSLGKARATFATLLAAYTNEGRNVSHLPTSPGYAPKLFAGDDRASGLSKEVLARAMNGLFAEKRIKSEPYGRPARPYQRLVTVHQEGAE